MGSGPGPVSSLQTTTRLSSTTTALPSHIITTSPRGSSLADEHVADTTPISAAPLAHSLQHTRTNVWKPAGRIQDIFIGENRMNYMYLSVR